MKKPQIHPQSKERIPDLRSSRKSARSCLLDERLGKICNVVNEGRSRVDRAGENENP
jgi:hypothetical protein